jgi:branched-chain amino acid transport system permease protein
VLNRIIKNRTVFGILLVAVLSMLLPLFMGNEYYINVLGWVFLNCVMAASMRFIMLSGHVNFAHGGFVGIGAYCSALMVMKVGLPFGVAIFVAGLTSSAIGICFGIPTLKLRGAYFFMASFGFAEVIRIIFHYFWKGTLGGVDGIIGIPWPQDVLGISFNPNEGFAYFYIILFVCTISLLIMYHLEKNTRLGPVLNGIQQAEDLAQSVGINTMKYKLVGFVIGCFFAGATGSLYAHFVGVISPYDFTFMLSVYILIYIVIGGKEFFVGPLIAATFLTMLSAFWLKELKFWEMVAYSGIMLLTVLFLPEGIMGLPKRIKAMIPKSRK